MQDFSAFFFSVIGNYYALLYSNSIYFSLFFYLWFWDHTQQYSVLNYWLCTQGSLLVGSGMLYIKPRFFLHKVSTYLIYCYFNIMYSDFKMLSLIFLNLFRIYFCGGIPTLLRAYHGSMFRDLSWRCSSELMQCWGSSWDLLVQCHNLCSILLA